MAKTQTTPKRSPRGGGLRSLSSFNPRLLDFDQNNDTSINRESNIKISQRAILAFTLAEVLITLGIIGIIASMTLPQLIKNYQKKVTAERLKSTYTIIKQAVLMSEAANGEMNSWVPISDNQADTLKKFIQLYYEPYLKVIQQNEFSSSDTPYDYEYFTNDGKLIKSAGHTKYSIALINGTYLHFNSHFNVNNNIELRIDINGKQKPNIVGIDTFYMTVYPKVEMFNEGKNRTQLLNWCKIPGQLEKQRSCGAVILNDGWQIKSDYPWH